MLLNLPKWFNILSFLITKTTVQSGWCKLQCSTVKPHLTMKLRPLFLGNKWFLNSN